VASVPSVPLAGPILDGATGRSFTRRILRAFTEGNALKPETTFGNVNADVLARFVPSFHRANFVDIIENSDWPE